MGNTPPQPADNLPHPCLKCGIMTPLWYSEYPKDSRIKYKCEKCRQIDKAESDQRMEQLRKGMADGTIKFTFN